jgi:hypothetical protein
MTLATPEAAVSVSPVSALSADYLLDTPLPQLLAELGVELEERPAERLPACGYAVVHEGRMALRMPTGQNRWEREMVARSMIGSAYSVPMPPLPAPFELTDLAAAA